MTRFIDRGRVDKERLKSAIKIQLRDHPHWLLGRHSLGARLAAEAAIVIIDPLTIAALRMALHQRQPGRPLIVHSDRGSQFASAAYRQVLAEPGLLASMSRSGNCYDNAFIESFWSSLKYELVYHQRFTTHGEARTAIFDYIETFL